MLTAGRMLSSFDSELGQIVETIGVNARLAAPYTFARLDGAEITLDMGTPIHVDETKGIASHGSDYFEVDPSDYVISFLN